jgi:hypothetical protein
MKVLIGTLAGKLFLGEDELESITRDFISALPATLKTKLQKCA